MGKLVFFTIIGLLIYWFVKSRQTNETQEDMPPEAIEDMVCCSYCGVHLPKSESVSAEEKFFCSDEHCHQFLDTTE